MNLKKLLATSLLLSVSLSTLTGCYQLFPKRTVSGQVTYLERVHTGDSYSYRVGLSNDEVFNNVDAIEIGKFNSANFQNKLQTAKDSKAEVTLEVYGYRVPFLHSFENISKIEVQK